MQKEKEFLDKMFRRSKSIHSRRFYRAGLRQLENFLSERKIRVTQKNVYSVFDDFFGWLDQKGIRAKTQINYVFAAKRYLRYVGLHIDDVEFRIQVTVPRVTKIPDEPLTIELVQTLLMKGRPNPKIRALLLTLLSSGMRLGEALGIKISNLDLRGSPSRIKLPAEITKSGVSRIAYVSDEARESIRQIVNGVSPNRLLFDYSGDAWQREKVATKTFREVVERAGLGERIPGHRTHKIHFHIFRKFFLTKGSDLLGEHAAHALCGHGFYMDTYYKKSEAERMANYLKLMPLLSVFAKNEQKVNVREELVRELLKISGFKTDEVESMELSSLESADIQRMVREKLLGAMTNNGNKQKVIPVEQVKVALGEGWEYVDQLPNNEAIVKLP